MKQCKDGKHSLIEVYHGQQSWQKEVVRWCQYCGAVTVDLDYDGRTNAGQIMKMKFPQLVKDLVIND